MSLNCLALLLVPGEYRFLDVDDKLSGVLICLVSILCWGTLDGNYLDASQFAMPNILDIRRRIRSVTNTRQITKAMKMVSAAKLRRAQERALSGRPYTQMLTSVLRSLMQRVDPYNPETGVVRHPLLVEREEKTVLVFVITGDKGLAGAFNTNICKAFLRGVEFKRGKNIDVIAVGRKGRDFLRRRYPAGQPGSERMGMVQITGESIGIFNKLEFSHAEEWAGQLVDRYIRGEADSVYLLFNEFKSVLSQRVVLQQILPISSHRRARHPSG